MGLTIRHSPDNEARKIGMETLLCFLENKSIHQYVRDDSDLAQTLAAISKFGASKAIKQRSANIIKTMLGNKAYLDMTKNVNKDRNSGNRPKFAKAKTLKSGIRSPSNKPKKSPSMRKTESSIDKKDLKVNTQDDASQTVVPDIKPLTLNPAEPKMVDTNQVDAVAVVQKEENTQTVVENIGTQESNENMNMVQNVEIDQEPEVTAPVVVKTQTSEKAVDFWHDEEEQEEAAEAAT